MHSTTRHRRLATVSIFVAVAAVAPAVVTASGGLADPSATTTTSTSTTTTVPRADDVAAVTTTSTTTTTQPSDVAVVTTSRPPTTTAAPPEVGPPTTPPTTAPAADVAIVETVPPGEPGQLTTGATVPRGPNEPVSIGEWSTDPADWSPEVREHLASQGFDADDPPAGATVGHGQIGGLLSNEGCAVNCITAGLAHAVGVGVHLEVTTSVPAFIQIEIIDVGLKFGPPSALSFGATWAHLEPGTTYDAIARAHDAHGNMAVASGSFTTLTRSASITFTPTVFWFGNLPDFDPFGDHLWQLSTEAFLDGRSMASVTGAPAANDDVQATAADLSLTIDTAPAADSVIDVAYVGAYTCVAGCEDVSFWDLFAAAIFGIGTEHQAVPPEQDHANGVADRYFWGTIANGIELDGYPDDVTSWTGHQFTFPLSTYHGEPVGPAVYLAADVTVDVSYVPVG